MPTTYLTWWQRIQFVALAYMAFARPRRAHGIPFKTRQATKLELEALAEADDIPDPGLLPEGFELLVIADEDWPAFIQWLQPGVPGNEIGAVPVKAAQGQVVVMALYEARVKTVMAEAAGAAKVPVKEGYFGGIG